MAFFLKRQLIQLAKNLPSKGQQTIYRFSFIVLIAIRTETLRGEPLARRGLVLDDFHADTCLNGSTHLRILFNTHAKRCAFMCTLHPKCISINFCGRRTCQLNSEDKYFRNVTLVKATGCSYYGMRLDQAPICEEKGVAKLITNDRNPGPCSINQKRHDSEWGQFEEHVLADNQSEWKKVETRECYPARHSGIKNCVTSETNVIDWLKFVHTEMTHDDAISACRILGGELFEKINGTTQQLLFFHQRLLSPYWLGIWKVGSPPVWQSISGVIIPNSSFFWADGEPYDDHPTENRLCVMYNYMGKGQFMHDCPQDAWSKWKAVCDMM